MDECVVCGDGFEFIGCGGEGGAGRAGHLGAKGDVEAGVDVQACSHGRPAHGEEAEGRERAAHAAVVVGELGCEAGEFLAEGQGDGVLKVRAPDFDDV